MSKGGDREDSSDDLSTWPLERLQAAVDGQPLEVVRVVARGHAYDTDQPDDVRREWAALSLLANRRLHGAAPGEQARELHQEFMLRMWVIDRHKNLTAHLARLTIHLRPGPILDRLLLWARMRRLLP